MNIDYLDSFKNDLLAIVDKKQHKRIADVLRIVEKANSLIEIPNLKKLHSKGNYFRIRVGDFRLGFLLKKDLIVFVRALPRKEIYRFFP